MFSQIPSAHTLMKNLESSCPMTSKCSESVVKGRAILLFLAPLVYVFSLKLFSFVFLLFIISGLFQVYFTVFCPSYY